MVELDIPQEVEETEEQKLARIRHRRALSALREAPDLILYVRSLIDHTERGEVLAEYVSPMRLTATDDSDAVYGQLVEWVTYWARVLEVDPPSTAAIASRNFYDSHPSAGYADAPVLGFRAGTTPEGAHMLIRLQTMWLLTHAERIHGFPGAEEYESDVTGLLWRLRGKYPTAPRRPRDVYPRPCPVCDLETVSAVWFSEDVHDVSVSCSHCGYEVPGQSYSRILDWLA
ncbi:hypothetical protein [Glaciibacter superstes]|uniref:hypothetical protein n=1 Tax=Glaciibacter superstes TaxID=501023 RepID=UPI0003B2FDA9|nr:hypothetical protein [Glaciibacter superstes]